MQELFTVNNMVFLLEGLYLTLYISVIAIFLSSIFGTILAIMRNQERGILKWIATIYIEIVRNVPNILWIFVIFLIFRLKSVDAGVASFTIFTTAALAEIIRGGLNSVAKGEIEAAESQGLTNSQIMWHIILPQAIRNMLPAIMSQFVTVIKDTSFLWSVLALQELLGKANILMGRYTATSQVFVLYGLLALIYFVVNFTISQIAQKLAKNTRSR
ncbi:amino acid ABC transporter permease [Aerococcaceae bacterium INB8]|uniref:Amino acid ABC transporter permease n=1 Tax=Ruoffia halotolerans TaxID=2748684 RepID=A0A839A7P0_9LACT|nr:amino acid ABC transporter permease [Ruoffia halotolerans]MBA5729693.1 amino acid ABC transporter permease [Ruoffia halotolerans]